MQPGDTAPDFTAPTGDGGSFTLSQLRGGRVVLFFYPKDSTPACTEEAVDFNALAPAFAAAGVTLVGVSKDSVKRHANFAAKNGLGMVLVSDAEGDICERYGAWGEKQLYGRHYLGIIRSTVLIDAEGRVERHWPKVSVKGHAAEVLAAVEGP